MRRIANKLEHLSLRQRFLVTPLLGLIMLAILLAAFVFESQRQNALLTAIARHHLSAFDRYSEAFGNLSTQHIALYELLVNAKNLDEEGLYLAAKSRLDAVHESIAKIEVMSGNDSDGRGDDASFVALHRELLEFTDAYRRAVTSAVEMKTVNLALAFSHIARANERFVAMNSTFSKLLERQRQGLVGEITRGVERSEMASFGFSLAAISGASFLLFLSLVLSRLLSSSLKEQIDVLAQLGNASGTDPRYADEDEVRRIGRVIETFKRTQDELRESEQRFRFFFEHNNAVMLMIEPESGAIRDANASAANFYGYSRRTLCAMTIQQINQLPPDEVAAEREKALDEIRNYFVFPHRLADGRTRTVEVHATPIAAGGRVLLFSIIHDITERQRAEEELRLLNLQLEQRIAERTLALQNERSLLRSLIDTIPDVIAVKDPEGTYLACNRAFARSLIGLSETEVVGKRAADLRPATDDFETEKLEHDVLAGGSTSREERWLRFADGRSLLMEIIKAPLFDYDGKIAGTIGVGHDITARSLREEALREARLAADAANRAKSAFLATMSHEIRTPMNGVIGMIEVLAHSGLSAHQAEAVKTIRDSAFALLDIIDEILDFSKIESGRLELERVPVGVAEIAEGVSNALVPVAASKGVDLTLFTAPRLPEKVWSDPTRLRQVLYNLVGNAIKFSGGRPQQRGRVAVRVEFIEAAVPQLMFSISDNGIGMAPEILANLFSPFTQAEVSTTRRFGGTGLGLVICKRLVELMCGEIEVSSTPGVGSTFTVRLPFEAVAGTSGASLPDLADQDCIVVASAELEVEDLRIYLEDAGARVYLAVDLAAAGDLAAGLDGAVVIHDSRQRGVSIEALHSAFAATSDVRHLLITQGRRWRARVAAPDVVTLDGDALRRKALLRAVAVAAGRASPEIFQESAGTGPAEPQVPPPGIDEARAQERLILIAEDDEINQKVILQQLALLGYAAEVAGNGKEALHRWRGGHYALLLTDMHMPEMDGFTLAEAIRREEVGRKRTPILVLTANALSGEAQRVRGAGADEYLTKPIQLQLLRIALEKWLPRTDSAAAAPRIPSGADRGASVRAVDVAILRRLVGDDPETVRGLLASYHATVRRLALELHVASAANDARQIAAIGHKLKSSSRSVGALAFGDRCADLERVAQTGDAAAIGQEMAAFEAELAAVDREITELLMRQDAGEQPTRG